MTESPNIKKLAEFHWQYTEKVLTKAVDVAGFIGIQREAMIELCKFLYEEAFAHGYKHCAEEIKTGKGN